MSLLRKIQIFSSNVAKLWAIDDANTARTTGTIVGAVQIVDQTGKVPPAGETLANAPYTKSTIYASGGTEIFTNANPAAISDGGGSITVDGTVTIDDGGSTISIDDNGSSISVDDGGGSITVDGAVTVSGTVTATLPTDDANTARTTGTKVLPIQVIDATGKVPPAGDAVGNAPFVKVTDGTNTFAISAANTARTTGTLVLPVQIVNDEGEIELTTIDYSHNKIHAGIHFTAQRLFTSVANDANADVRILNGATKKLHIMITAACGGNSYFYTYEGTTYSNNGTGLTAYNNDRSSLTATTATLYYTPTINVLGTAIMPGELIPAGNKNALMGASSATRLEIILAVNTDYLFRITNKSGGAIDISMCLAWYEHSV